MLEIYYDSVSYTDFLQTVARNFKARINDGLVAIPSNIGMGYMKATMLPNGISVLVRDCKFTESVTMLRRGVPMRVFSFLFAITSLLKTSRIKMSCSLYKNFLMIGKMFSVCTRILPFCIFLSLVRWVQT